MKKKRDILFLCQFFYPEYISSAQLPFDTVKALKKAGFSVDVLCGYPREYSASENVPVKETVEGVQIRRLKYIQLEEKLGQNIIGQSKAINIISKKASFFTVVDKFSDKVFHFTVGDRYKKGFVIPKENDDEAHHKEYEEQV